MFKHTATIDGVTFTRDSQSRIYTHCIVVKTLLSAERVEIETGARKGFTEQFKRAQEVIAGGHKWDRNWRRNRFRTFNCANLPVEVANAEADAESDKHDADQLAQAQAYVKTSVDDRVAARMAEYDEGVATSKFISSDGLYRYYGGSEWCGRLDLAVKAIAKWQSRGEIAYAAYATYREHTPKPRKAKG